MPTIFDDQSLQKYLPVDYNVPASANSVNQIGQQPQNMGPDNSIGAGPYVAAGIGNALDGLSTYKALSSNPNAIEANPLLPNGTAKNAVMKGGMSLGELLLMRALASHGHPTMAKALGYGSGLLGAGLALNNLSKAK